MKKIIITLLFLCVIMCSCEQKSYPISLHQDTNNIIRIELIKRTTEDSTMEYTLSEDEIDEFIASLLEMSCYVQHPPCTVYGRLLVQLHYKNGDIEIIGTGAIGYKTSVSEEINGKYYVPLDNMYELFDMYFDD